MSASTEQTLQGYTRMSDIIKEPNKMLMPIHGYEKMPLVSLEDAVLPLISMLPRIEKYVYVAKPRYDRIC